MRRVALTAVIVLALRGVALAQVGVGPQPDPWAPNNDVVVPAPGGGTNTLGYDSRKWTYTQTQTDPRGNVYGYDAHGNYWTYNRRTNTYRYYGTDPRWQGRCYTSAADLC